MTRVRVVSKREAIQLLGISKRTLERRLAAGAYATSTVHGPHGPERRIHLPDTAGEGGPPAADTPGTAVMAAPPASPDALLLPESEAVALLLGVLDERQRKIEDWAVRAGRAEAERDALRAEVAALRRPWWRKLREKLPRE